jgi:hypothetical protein
MKTMIMLKIKKKDSQLELRDKQEQSFACMVNVKKGSSSNIVDKISANKNEKIKFK